MRLRRAGQLLDAHRQAIRERDAASRGARYASDIRRLAVLISSGEAARPRDLLDRHGPTGGTDDLRGFEWHDLRGQVRREPRGVGRA